MSRKSIRRLAKAVDVILCLICFFVVLLFIASYFAISVAYDIAIIALILLGAVLCIMFIVYLIFLFIGIVNRLKTAKKSDQ